MVYRCSSIVAVPTSEFISLGQSDAGIGRSARFMPMEAHATEVVAATTSDVTSHDQSEGGVSSSTGCVLRETGPDYMQLMLQIYTEVVRHGLPNFIGTRLTAY